MEKPTYEEVEAISKETWINFFKVEYGNECSEPSWFEVEDDCITLKTFCTGLNQTYGDVSFEQYHKMVSGYYDELAKSLKENQILIVEYMGFEIKGGYYARKGNNGFIHLDGEYEFRPHKKWKDAQRVLDFLIEEGEITGYDIQVNGKEIKFDLRTSNKIITKETNNGNMAYPAYKAMLEHIKEQTQ